MSFDFLNFGKTIPENSFLTGTGKFFVPATAFLLGISLAGCSFLPKDGPSAEGIRREAKGKTNPKTGKIDTTPYQLITVTKEVAQALKKAEATGSDSGMSTLVSPLTKTQKEEKLFRSMGVEQMVEPPRQTIAAGDVLNVTLYESGGNLFGGGVQADKSAGSVGTALPPQTVDESGQITVPFAGRVQAIGKTTYEVEQEIVTKLTNKAIDPQAIVTMGGRKGGDLVTVTGDVKTPILVPVSLSGTRLLDAVTAAGGSTGTMYESMVTVIRGGQAKSERLSDIMANVKNNVSLQPGDTVILRNRPWTYLAFGAIGKTGRFPLQDPDLTLAEALANAGGAMDARAEPIAYLYRIEPTSFVKQLGLTPLDKNAATTQVIYAVNLDTAEGLFLAQNISIRDKDVLYFPSADSIAVLKFMNILNALTAPARSGLSTASGLDSF